MYINYKAKRVFIWLISIITILTILNSIGVYLIFNTNNQYVNSFIKVVDFDTENSIPTFFSAVILLISSGLLFYISSNHKKHNIKHLPWLILAFVFLFLSMDESAALHERLSTISKNTFNLSGYFYFGWVVPYSVFLIILTVIYVPFLLKLEQKTRKILIISAIIFVSGALVIELFEAKHYEANGVDIGYCIYYTFEEIFEMLGVSIFIYGLLDYISINITNKIN